MIALKNISLLISVAMLAACTTVPPTPQKSLTDLDRNKGYTVKHSTALDLETHTLRPLNESKDVLYAQNFGGGGVGLGLLLGPIGVAANIAMIKSQTDQDVEKLTTFKKIKSEALFSESAVENKLDLKNSGLNVSPYIYLQKTESNEGELKIVPAAAIYIEMSDAERTRRNRYVYQLDREFTLEQLASLSETEVIKLQSDFKKSYSHLISFIKSESDSDNAEIKFDSKFITPRLEFELSGKLINDSNGRVWVRLPDGVFSLTKKYFSPKS
ncbi:hypothetical protein HNQ59_002587 [Chitinivorax tropicus]|uniref:Lipoprotein n=1 Tax=Chitinivorax tropicus TaxID=714531 RepID=A0A840MQD2_9PROT|nr:hypothetical protein [Chitinivorax tropicus]MBB5019289.1 hypothetical protein [Chitinivorax tropicus]